MDATDCFSCLGRGVGVVVDSVFASCMDQGLSCLEGYSLIVVRCQSTQTVLQGVFTLILQKVTCVGIAQYAAVRSIVGDNPITTARLCRSGGPHLPIHLSPAA